MTIALSIRQVRPQASRQSPLRLALAALAGQPVALVAAAIVATVVVVAVGADLIAPFDPAAADWAALREPPSRAHLFGTDDLGRDILSRMIFGARASLMASLVSVSIAFAVGVPVGLCAGYLGGLVDGVVTRFTDAMLAIPALIFAVSLAAFLGPSLINAVIAIGVAAIPVFVRLSRAQAMGVKFEEYVEAAYVVGNPRWRIVLRHIFPNIVPALIVQATLTMAFAVIAEASLSFLGVGQQPPGASWGNMLTTAKNYLEEAPWMAIWPGAAIFLMALSFNLLGDTLQDVLDPRSRPRTMG
ncbi:ABC transporter permease [Bradyrhizobium sp. KB893862 SZCCT0404]|uniref:ABC transporter permease n=1 Tax=Bradyrhizobium sp. KB893862 SZCCT0404 TaxID=2807672 RepID=UPI001BA5EFEE|nr:ABC transporter permease [Bradyrhizobium sp. KB893862 SZCCT0404]MBR1177193.1 ABC transporter permease [Bradyrhizobium sp. KB893862 SZCCT0404]